MLARKWAGPLAAGWLFLSLCGCGQSRGKVSGTVSLEGKPLTLGTVVLTREGTAPINAVIAKDGTYTVQDVPYGKILVTVFSPDPAPEPPTKPPKPGTK